MDFTARPDCPSCNGTGEGNEIVDSVGNKGPCLPCYFAPSAERAEVTTRKRAIVERLLTAWGRAPTLRLGQLIANAQATSHSQMSLLRVEDVALAVEVERYVGGIVVPEER